MQLFFIAIIFSLASLSGEPEEFSVDFCLISMPKCGTHLSTKLLEMLTKRKKCPVSCLNSVLHSLNDSEFESTIKACKEADSFLYGHTNPLGFAPFFFRYAQEHPETIVFCPIRDLRSMIISYVFDKYDCIEAELGKKSSFDEILLQVLDPTHSLCGQLIQIQAQCALDFLQLPNVYPIFFEDLVGIKGGGTNKAQQKCILNIASRIGAPLNKQKLRYICRYLFGNDKKDKGSKRLPRAGTFREGKIDSWRLYFKSEHQALFKQYWHYYQKEFKEAKLNLNEQS